VRNAARLSFHGFPSTSKTGLAADFVLRFQKRRVCNKLYHKMSGHSFTFFSRRNETLFIVLGFAVLVEGKEEKGF
jgi:hypothetical protein